MLILIQYTNVCFTLNHFENEDNGLNISEMKILCVKNYNKRVLYLVKKCKLYYIATTVGERKIQIEMGKDGHHLTKLGDGISFPGVIFREEVK